MSQFFRLIGDLGGARRVLCKVKDANSTSHRYAAELSLVADMLGDYATAEQAIARAIAVHYCSLYLKMQAYFLMRLRRLDRAINSLEQAQHLLPGDPAIGLLIKRAAGFARTSRQVIQSPVW
jgi:Flp pilus assembly protein TadD